MSSQRLSKTSESKYCHFFLFLSQEAYQVNKRGATLQTEDSNQLFENSPHNTMANSSHQFCRSKSKNVIKKVKSLHQILTSISDRRKTFGTFAFQTTELDDEKNLNILLKDFVWKNQKGTMYVNELWPSSNLDSYIRQNQFYNAKRMMKRFSNMSHQSVEQKVSNFTNKDEINFKFKLLSINGEERVRQEIQQKFTQKTLLNLRSSQVLYNKLNKFFQKIVSNGKLLGGQKININTTEDDNSSEKLTILQILKSIDQIRLENKSDKKKYDQVVQKLQNKIISTTGNLRKI